MKKIIVAILLLASTSSFAAFHFKVGPIKVSSKSIEKIKKEIIVKPGDAIASVAKGVGKWADTELITTIKGDRALHIKPYVALTYEGKGIKVGPDEAYIKVAGLSIKTSNFKKRLLELGCIAGSEGAGTLICLTPETEKLFKQEAGDPGIPAEAVGGAIPTPAVTELAESNWCPVEPAYSSCFTTKKRPVGSLCGCFDEKGDLLVSAIELATKKSGDMIEVMMPPPKSISPGFDF